MLTERGKVLYRQDRVPLLQNRVYDSEAEAKSCALGDVVLVEDVTTGLVYNAAFKAQLVIYDQSYQNEQAVSPAFRVHLNEVSHIVDRLLGKEAIVEVGCGKGTFLEMLAARGFDIVGFDPAYEGNNRRVEKRYFDGGSKIRARGLILRHVLEHIENPYTFLCDLRDANGGGKIYIEVPCFDWICKHRAWFDIFFEHVNYFRLKDFYRMFKNVIESGHMFDGQYVYVVADLSSLREPRIDPKDCVAFPFDFGASALIPPRSTPGPAAVWGAGSKGVIFSLLRSRAGESIGAVIDISPAKQGKYLPVTGFQIKSPEEAMRTLPRQTLVYVMNSNYFEEIKRMSRNLFSYEVIDDE